MDSIIIALITVLGDQLNDKTREYVYDQLIPEIYQHDESILEELDVDDPIFEKSYSNFIKANRT